MTKSKLTINADVSKRWKLPNGNLHREDGPAIEYSDGTKFWYINGNLHREDSPAVEYANGDKWWFLNGKLHREDGPAIKYDNGHKEWYYHDQKIDCKNNEEFLKLIKLKAFW